MNTLVFEPTTETRLQTYMSPHTDKLSIIKDASDGLYYIRIWEDGWQYPSWQTTGFTKIDDAQNWLNIHDWNTATSQNIDTSIQSDPYLVELDDAMRLLGFYVADCTTDSKIRYHASVDTADSVICIHIACSVDNILSTYVLKDEEYIKSPFPTSDIGRVIRCTEKLLSKYGVSIFASSSLTSSASQSVAILAGRSTRDIMRDMVRVKSSNVWAYAMNVKNHKDKYGDVYVQFKDKNGGPGDVYVYYDVPVLTYRRWHSASSKGHYFWRYIRNYFRYSKLTGDKRGKLPNAIN